MSFLFSDRSLEQIAKQTAGNLMALVQYKFPKHLAKTLIQGAREAIERRVKALQEEATHIQLLIAEDTPSGQAEGADE